MINEYFINEDTLILVPDNDKTKVYDKEGIYDVNNKIMNIVEISCNYYGSSFLGRCVGSKSILNMNYKLPIIIDEVKEVILIPTSSPNNKNCYWICLNNVENYYKKENKVIVEFSNKLNLEVDSSYYSLENQILRATLLLTRLKKRKNIIKKVS